MTEYHISPVWTYDDSVQHVSRFMRQSDRDEIWAVGGYLAHEALRASVQQSSEAYVGFIDDTPAAVFGVMGAALGQVGVPWMLGTDAMDTHPVLFMRIGRRFVKELDTKYQTLHNVVHDKNEASVRLLTGLGFAPRQSVPLRDGERGMLYWRQRHV